ncbi:hypothetical protein C8R46DRAFT_1068858 [Mycena filopes]|nr:hypothetical protein C8R46DRAFT_1110123 [Mycena filopes]KAJ7181990.1 hypothetical protein C8R46DRAFT_1068858 [Mycena filopes]
MPPSLSLCLFMLRTTATATGCTHAPTIPRPHYNGQLYIYDDTPPHILPYLSARLRSYCSSRPPRLSTKCLLVAV